MSFGLDGIKMDWTSDRVRKLIALIRLHPCLWDSTDKNRKRKRKINDAHIEISSKLNISVNDVKKKINSLRSQMSGKFK